MKPFFKLKSRKELQDIIKEFSPLESVNTDIAEALNHALASDIKSPEDLPPFTRSTMDGFAVRAADTFGASETQPALFEVAGEVRMGCAPDSISLKPGQAARIWTGGELPRGSDAVVMVEYTEAIDASTIEVSRAVSPQENTVLKGEDVKKDSVVLARGRRLRPQELGLLAGLGISGVPVYRQPVVAVISTGDELVPADSPPQRGKIRDINSTSLCALVKIAGGIPVHTGIVNDSRQGLTRACLEALDLPADVVLVSGGSSVGQRDYTIEAFKAVENSSIMAHGVSVRPGKPTILAKAGKKALVGLPGHVASALVVFCLFIYPLLKRFQGFSLPEDLYLPEITARITRNYPSQPGREEYLRVSLKGDTQLPDAEPIFGKSGLIYPMVRADGLLVIPRDSEGLYAGDRARVMLLP